MPDAHTCPDCDEPLIFAFMDTAGVGAWKQGEGVNTTPDIAHYICFPCGRSWKQRLDGPLTQDIIGDLAFFSCKKDDCGAPLTVTQWSPVPTEIELACANGHQCRVQAEGDELMVVINADPNP